MRWIAALAAAVFVSAGAIGAEPAATPSADRLAGGTLLFLENCSSVVEWSTRGEIAHVALVFHVAGEPWVYEATPAVVRRATFADYQTELSRLNQQRAAEKQVRMFALRPKIDYAPDEARRMQEFLDSQLGRRYSIKNYVRGKPYDGIHCAELASTTLNQSGRYAFADCHKIHPRALYEAMLATHCPPEQIEAAEPLASEAWSVRFKRSCSGWWNWCGWSCREAWLFF
jgi:hypothetical protein